MRKDWDDYVYEDEDDVYEHDVYEDEDDDDDDETELIPCPSCGAEIYEESERCPACGEYITASTSPFAGRPWWWVALGLLGIAAVILTLSWLLL